MRCWNEDEYDFVDDAEDSPGYVSDFRGVRGIILPNPRSSASKPITSPATSTPSPAPKVPSGESLFLSSILLCSSHFISLFGASGSVEFYLNYLILYSVRHRDVVQPGPGDHKFARH